MLLEKRGDSLSFGKRISRLKLLISLNGIFQPGWKSRVPLSSGSSLVLWGTQNKQETLVLELSKVLKPIDNTPCVVTGDLKKILYHYEKWEGKEQSENIMSNFRDALDYCSLNDLGMRSNQFTWSNKHEDDTFTKEILDRAVANLS